MKINLSIDKYLEGFLKQRANKKMLVEEYILGLIRKDFVDAEIRKITCARTNSKLTKKKKYIARFYDK